MFLALIVALSAVLLGLALGLAPVVIRRALGPLRTLALAAVISVVLVHLLPEALSELGFAGLLVFAAALAAPRWIPRWVQRDRHRAHTHGQRGSLGLELGFWGLVVHHLGDGIALGAYSRVDEHTGHSHADVLLALVLHTVPLVAVVAAGYARARGTRSALLRALTLAAASALGIFAVWLVPSVELGHARAWIAAAVAGLLLHGMTHDLAEDLPRSSAARSFDLAAALLGGGFGWLGGHLEAHPELAALPLSLGAALWQTLARIALPLTVGLLLGPLCVRALRGRAPRGLLDGFQAERGALLGPEALLLGIAHLGLVGALLAQLVNWLGVWLRLCSADSAPALQAPQVSYRAALAQRVDRIAVWPLAVALIAAVMLSALPVGTLSTVHPGIAAALVLIFVLGIPLHVAAAPVLAFPLWLQGFPPFALFLLVVAAPLAFALRGSRRWALPAVALAAGWLWQRWVLPGAAPLNEWLTWAAVAILAALVVSRIYQLGLRGWLLPLVGSASLESGFQPELSASAGVVASLRAESAPTPGEPAVASAQHDSHR